jgi:NAD(P)-dependent dehydrogenase (short-subunit alcohol dehydrogenase family)
MTGTTAEPLPLAGKVALVAGATRGAGRGIAVALGEAGATVIATGRSTRRARSAMDRPETIEETAELVTAAGGTGVAIAVDHAVPGQVEALVARIDADHGGRLDVLVNDIWGGDPLTHWGRRFWEYPLDDGLRLLRQAIDTHLITSRYAVPLMLRRRAGLIVEITDGVGADYRGSLYYDLAKTSVIRLAFAQAEELRPHGIAAVALTPGFLRSEAMLDIFGVGPDNWRDAIAMDRHFAASESPLFVGRAVAALAADPDIMTRSGQALSSWQLAHDYGFVDADGSRPDWGRHFREHVASS